MKLAIVIVLIVIAIVLYLIYGIKLEKYILERLNGKQD